MKLEEVGGSGRPNVLKHVRQKVENKKRMSYFPSFPPSKFKNMAVSAHKICAKLKLLFFQLPTSKSINKDVVTIASC